jgi:TonB-linked SusC/RagA family outer membrane protein
MKHINFLILFLTASLFACCQSLVIKGKVINEDGEPIINATITHNRTHQSVITSNKGEFSIDHSPLTPSDSRPNEFDTLIITAIGYETKRLPIQHLKFNIQHNITLFKKSTTLSEVTISTGYQEIPKERATGSFSTLDNKLLNQQVSPGIISRLEAIANSLSVDRITGNTGRLQVRGLSTIIGPRDPLIVLDNFPYEGDINNINPNDIESITILKDAAATSIWGARAGNGVIIITSKKTKANQPLLIEWNNNINVITAPDLFYRKQMTPSEYIEVEQMLFNNNNRLSDTANINRPAFSPAYEILIKQRNGQLTAQQAEALLEQLRNHDMRNDFNKYIYKPSVAQQHHLSLQFGSQQLAWNFSLGYDRTNNELSATNDRISLRISNQFRPSRQWLITTGIYFTRAASASGKTGFDQMAAVAPLYSSIADEGGNPLPVIKTYRQPWLDTVGRGRLLDWNYYPLTDHKYSTTKTINYDLLLNTAIKYQLFSWLSADIKYQYEKQELETNTFNDLQSYFTRDRINTFTRLGKTNAPDTFRIPKGAINDIAISQLQSHSFRPQLTVNKTTGLHSINAIAGFEIRHTSSISRSSRLYGYDPETQSFNNVDFATPYPTFITGSTSFIPSGLSVNDRLNRFVSLFANAAYTYKNRYTFSLSGRRDASNLFGVNTNDKWQPLWSSGFLWDISKEYFFNNKWLSSLRLRTTYGVSGNIDPSRAAVTTINYLLSNPYTQTPIANIDRIANPELQWEKVHMFNTGIDFVLRGNRLSGSIEYYHKSATGLFGLAPVDYTAGVGASIVKNVASMGANGIDIELDAVLINKPFRWTMQLNYSFYKDKVKDYYLSSLQASNFVRSGSPGISGLKDYPVYSIFSYYWAGLDALGDPMGFLNGQPSKDYNTLTGTSTLITDLKFHGAALPVHFGSLGNTFAWKNIELSFRLMYKLGHYFRRPSIAYASLFTNLVGHSDYRLRWQKPGDEQLTNVPAMIYPSVSNRNALYTGSEALIEKADHIRLRYISLAWTIYKQQWKKLPLRSLQLYSTIDNIGIIWRANKHGIDPESPTALIPASRSIAAGVRISF